MALLADRATAPAAPRALPVPAALLTLSVAAVFVVAIGLWSFTWPIADDGDRALRWMVVALALGLPASRNVAAGIVDLRGPAESFQAFMAERDTTLRRLHAAGVTDAVLPVIAKADFPRCYVFHADIRTDGGFWINRWTALCYGLAVLRAAAP